MDVIGVLFQHLRAECQLSLYVLQDKQEGVLQQVRVKMDDLEFVQPVQVWQIDGHECGHERQHRYVGIHEGQIEAEVSHSSKVGAEAVDVAALARKETRVLRHAADVRDEFQALSLVAQLHALLGLYEVSGAVYDEDIPVVVDG